MLENKSTRLPNMVRKPRHHEIWKGCYNDQYKKYRILETDKSPHFNHYAGQLTSPPHRKFYKPLKILDSVYENKQSESLNPGYYEKILNITVRYVLFSIFPILALCSDDCNPMSASSLLKQPSTTGMDINPLNPAPCTTQVSGLPHPTNNCSLTQTGSGLVNYCPPSQVTQSQMPAQMTQSQMPAQMTYPSSPYTPVQQQPGLNCVTSCKKIIKKGAASPLSSLEKIDPTLTKELQRILTYSGIKEPWDRIKDFFDDKQRMMPDPCMLYSQMRDILKVFESLKELISDELRKIQIYVERAKMYLKEDHVKLKDQLARMSQLLARMKSTKDKKIQADQANSFNKVNEETQGEISEYNQLKDWLFETLTYFKKLF